MSIALEFASARAVFPFASFTNYLWTIRFPLRRITTLNILTFPLAVTFRITEMNFGLIDSARMETDDLVTITTRNKYLWLCGWHKINLPSTKIGSLAEGVASSQWEAWNILTHSEPILNTTTPSALAIIPRVGGFS
jgi:hypothetical protein